MARFSVVPTKKNKLNLEDFVPKRENFQCFSCKTYKNEKFPTCARCKCVQYCSKKCQVKDYPKHKAFCFHIKTMRAQLKPVNLVSVQYYDYNDMITPPFHLAMMMAHLAFENEYDQALEKALENLFEILDQPLMEEDADEVKITILFFLLMLGKIQGAFDFLTHSIRSKEIRDSEVTFNNDVTQNLLHEYKYTVEEMFALLIIKLSIMDRIRKGDIKIPNTKLAQKIEKIYQAKGGEGEFEMTMEARKCMKEQEQMAKKCAIFLYIGEGEKQMEILSDLEAENDFLPDKYFLIDYTRLSKNLSLPQCKKLAFYRWGLPYLLIKQIPWGQEFVHNFIEESLKEETK